MKTAENKFWQNIFETRINCGLDYVWITDPNVYFSSDTKYFIKKVEWDRLVLSHNDECKTIQYDDLYEAYDYDSDGTPYIMLKIKNV